MNNRALFIRETIFPQLAEFILSLQRRIGGLDLDSPAGVIRGWQAISMIPVFSATRDHAIPIGTSRFTRIPQHGSTECGLDLRNELLAYDGVQYATFSGHDGGQILFQKVSDNTLSPTHVVARDHQAFEVYHREWIRLCREGPGDSFINREWYDFFLIISRSLGVPMLCGDFDFASMCGVRVKEKE